MAELNTLSPKKYSGNFAGLTPTLDVNNGVLRGDLVLDTSSSNIWTCVANTAGSPIYFLSHAKSLTITSLKTSAYTAAVEELIPCDISAGSFSVTLPSAPADGAIVEVLVNDVGVGTTVECKASGTDVLTRPGGPTSVYLYYRSENCRCQYKASEGVWYLTRTANPYNFAVNFPGISAYTPITNAEIAINTTSRVLSITPTKGYFEFFTDGGGLATRYRKLGTTAFPAFTDTSGAWYFYFNSAGVAVTTQTPWSTADFSSVAPVYRLLWNATLYSFTVTAANATVGATYTNNGKTYTVLGTIAGGTTLKMSCPSGDPQASGTLTYASGTGDATITFSAFSSADKKVAEYIEYHLNDIPADTHQWMHLQGSIWGGGLGNFDIKHNATTGTPNADGRNAVIAFTTGTNVDDNLEYTVTNSAAGTPWTQDMGETTPASLNATNAGLFKVFTQDAAGLVSFLPATRFPFAWNTASNRPELISAIGVRTEVTDNRWFVYFVYATQNPNTGEALKLVCFPTIQTSLTNSRAINWTDIQTTYPAIFGVDTEIRPMARLIFYNNNSGGGAYDVGTKYTALQEVQDLRKLPVTSTVTAAGSLPASSVTFVPTTSISSTNVQSAIEEIFSVRRQTKFFTASAFTPAITNGAIAGNEETTTYKRNYDYLAFKGVDNDTSAAVKFRMPEDWDLSTIKVKIDWGIATGATPTTDDVQFEISAGAIRNDSSMDYDLGTVVDLVDTVIAVGDLHQTAASGAVTVGGTPALGDLITMKIARDYNHDDVIEDVKVYGVTIEFGVLPVSPTAW